MQACWNLQDEGEEHSPLVKCLQIFSGSDPLCGAMLCAVGKLGAVSVVVLTLSPAIHQAHGGELLLPPGLVNHEVSAVHPQHPDP